jgi:hypothetical protein
MSEITDIQQAIDEAALLLVRKDYQTLEAVSNISRIFLGQAIIFELRQRYHLTFVRIGKGVGRSEKTVRYSWYGANHCIGLEDLVALAKFYLEMRAKYDKKS